MSVTDNKNVSNNSPSGATGTEYNFRDIEKKWQEWWEAIKVYQVPNESPKPKCYVLDMFPYPSGAGLHVGHPLGFIASDIYARFKRLKGFNVLHTMGYDAFGLPAEQYAIDHGIHPAISTETNINNFRSQLDKIGFCFDWSREVNTSKPEYYKWTQWIFLQLFGSFYNRQTNKAEKIHELIKAFEKEGNKSYPVPDSSYQLPVTGNRGPATGNHFTSAEWTSFDEFTQQSILMQYRLAYCGIGEVNWCEALGTVLANDEVINGVSERGGYPVVKKKLRQWYLRITEYADRLLDGLKKVEFSEAMKEMQTNWIGKSSGAEIDFRIRIGEPVQTNEKTYEDSTHRKVSVTIQISESDQPLRVYTTRPDTIFGVDFMVIAPEHELVEEITTDEQKQAVEEYIAYVNSRSERERMAEKKISGVFTGSYAINPFNGKEIPVWISEYVLAGYGTGAIMAVPCGDERDHRFARHFNIPITNIIGKYYNGEDANPTKEAILENSDFINGMIMKDAIDVVIKKIEELEIGVRKVNYKMRDAAFSRQRYWGEPILIKWINGIAYPLDEKELPLKLPKVDSYKPGPEGEGPLANIKEWTDENLETNTMPGYAGSSWYFLRYMDPQNKEAFCERKISDYWNQVDLYIGGTEHAVGHLLYSRMWTKALYDLGYIGYDEPYKKLVNQGMIQGLSAFAHFIGVNFGTNISTKLDEDQQAKLNQLREKYKAIQNKYISSDLMKFIRVVYNDPKTEEEINHMKIANNLYRILTKSIHEEIISLGLKDIVRITPFINYYRTYVPVEYVNYKDELDIERAEKDIHRLAEAEFIVNENNKFICSREVEKMSKSKVNTVNPDEIINSFGADTYRMYEMFLGPVEMSKPWDTKGIEGVHRFLKKLWRLFYKDSGSSQVSPPIGGGDLEGAVWTDEKATDAELKVLHTTIKKIESDTERFSFNTAVSAFMIAVNELTDLKCYKREILEPLLILLAPYAPHIAEELYAKLRQVSPPTGGGDLEGAGFSILNATYPRLEEKYLVESSKEYPISINGKLRTTISIALGTAESEVEQIVLANEVIQKWLEGKPPKKIIYKEGKMVNVVV